MEGSVGGSEVSPEPAGRAVGRIMLLYSVQRLGVFVTTTVALAAVGLRGLPLLAVAVLLSSVLSLFLLRHSRQAMTAAVAARGRERRESRQRVRARLDEDSST